jgi:iron complex transport system substrate-binding protein
MLQAVLTIGEQVDCGLGARALHQRLEAALDECRRRARERPPLRVLFVLQRDPFYVAGKASYLGELLEATGAINAAGSLAEAWPTVSAEALITFAPDVIIDASTRPANPDVQRKLDEWRRFPGLPAVERDAVYPLPADELMRPGPSLPRALQAQEELHARVPVPPRAAAKGSR